MVGDVNEMPGAADSPGVDFVGGPLDGYAFTVEQVNRVGFVVFWKPGRSFVRMPPMAVCEAIFRRRVDKHAALELMGDGWARWSVYERVWLGEKQSEFREAAERYAEVVGA